MGKHEKGTPKEIANRCKSKGLQKLRWYCQMCKKQCRDQNGFKCHLTSEAHQRQLLLFAENPNTYLREYSSEFEKRFLNVLRCTFGTKRVRANEVYQEFIRDKMHVHMNSTIWHTLTNFVLYLGSSGKCRIDQTERGWYIALIDQEEEMRKEEARNKAKASTEDDERHQQLLDRQIERARELAASKDIKFSLPTELNRKDENEKITFALPVKRPAALSLNNPGPSNAEGYKASSNHDKVIPDSKVGHHEDKKIKREETVDDKRSIKKEDLTRDKQKHSVRKTALEEIMKYEEGRKERQNRKDYWLHEGIVVKVISKKLGAEFYKAKGVVTSIIDHYIAVINVNGNIIKIDQTDLETVIPAIEGRVLIVNGAYRGSRAILESIIESKYAMNVRIDEGLAKGRVICIPYEDASKLA